jgi:hypothetical protein
MTSPRNETSDATLTTWAAALTGAGWNLLTVDDIPAHITGPRHLTDPTGRVEARAHAHAHADRDVDVTLVSTARRSDNGPAWHVIAGWLPAEVVIAAARDADQDTVGQEAGDLLTAAGWRLQRYERVTPAHAEHQWADDDDTRWAQYTTEDPDPDDGHAGGWLISTPGQAGRSQRTLASARTPAATIAAIALTA